jgi:hypothetical protein
MIELRSSGRLRDRDRRENGAGDGNRTRSVGSILREKKGDLLVSKQKLRKAEAVLLVRVNRESGTHAVGFASRAFVRCGLPIKRRVRGTLLHERRNGQFLLQVFSPEAVCLGAGRVGIPFGRHRAG